MEATECSGPYHHQLVILPEPVNLRSGRITVGRLPDKLVCWAATDQEKRDRCRVKLSSFKLNWGTERVPNIGS